MTRQLRSLRWVRLAERPSALPRSRPRGAKAKGLAYEADLRLGLGTAAIHGQWFEFEDLNGRGWCQVDWIVPWSEGTLVVLECKLTWTPEAFRQLGGLYVPIVEKVWGCEVLGLQVCRNLVPGLSSVVVGDLERGVEVAKAGREACWHWLGSGRRPPRPRRMVAHLGLADALL